MIIFIGRLDTGHYEFATYASTETEARTLMKSAWKIHQKNTGAWLTWREVKTSVQIEAVTLGTHTIR